MKNKFYSFLAFAVLTFQAGAQCDSNVVQSDMNVTSTTLMSGIYVIEGTFTLDAGATIYVTPYSTNGCGKLKIYADEIIINGDINGDFAGYEGGVGGSKGLDVSSITGHGASLTSCNDEGSQGHIAVEGGLAGEEGNGPGGGVGGNNGTDGSGTKQYCGNFGDAAGIVGGAGGAGAGSGGSYGGTGTGGASGGDGSANNTPSGIDVETSYPANAGVGGTGGTAPVAYGTEHGRDIHMGSGGAGAGGGGRSHYLGTDGGQGGSGGGLVFLKATNGLTFTGTISVNGDNGTYGGNGGSGDATADCCSDGCNGCDERTFSCGSGAGGGSGAGSGGGVFIESLGTATISGTILATGGNGGLTGQKGLGASCIYDGGVFCGSESMETEDGNIGGDGGSGGGGRVKIFVLDCAQANVTATVDVSGGTGAQEGTYAEVCGYAGVQENTMDEDWLVYPNPFTESFKIVVDEQVENATSVQVVSALGQVVAMTSITGNETEINLKEVESGIYFVHLISSKGTSIKKMIKR